MKSSCILGINNIYMLHKVTVLGTSGEMVSYLKTLDQNHVYIPVRELRSKIEFHFRQSFDLFTLTEDSALGSFRVLAMSHYSFCVQHAH